MSPANRYIPVRSCSIVPGFVVERLDPVDVASVSVSQGAAKLEWLELFESKWEEVSRATHRRTYRPSWSW